MKHLFASKYLLKITGLNVEKLLNNLLIWKIKIFYVNRTAKGEFFYRQITNLIENCWLKLVNYATI